MTEDRATKYARDVCAGRIPANKHTRWACKRHLFDLKRKDLVWDLDEAARRIGFFSLLNHFKGECAGQPFDLDDWEAFLIGSVFGWKLQDGRRRFHWVYCEIPRKTGKTTLASGIALMGMTIEKEAGAEVYAVATKEDQAKLLWNSAVKMIKRSPGFSKRLTCRVKEVRNESLDAVFRPLGSDTDTQDGLHPSIVIADELHAWKGERGRALWQVIKEAFARRNPLMVAITTAGYDQTGICWTQREHCLRVLDPESDVTDDETFALIYGVDEGDEKNWQDEAVWHKANPGLGKSKPIESMRSQAKQAHNMPTEQNAFLTKHLNIWTQQMVRWLDMAQWESCGLTEPPDLTGAECFVGVDLASTVDLASVAYWFPEYNALRVDFFCPEDTVREKSIRDKVPYDQWVAQGFIEATDGNRIHHDRIEESILENSQRYTVREVGIDRWNSAQLTTHLMDEGLECVGFGQGFRDMSGPAKELERMVGTGELQHFGNPVLRWQAECVSVATDPAENIKPVKPDRSVSPGRIDGIVAAIMAIGLALQHADEGTPEIVFLDQ